MKKTVFIQNIPHYPTAWGDATASWNLASFFKGMGAWYAKAYQQKLKFWSKQNFNIILDSIPNEPTNLLLRHFMMSRTPSGTELRKVIDITEGIKYLDAHPSPGKSCAYGVFFDPNHSNFSTEYIVNESAWFTRQPHDYVVEEEEAETHIKSKFVRLNNLTPITENNNIGTIVWFFLYRAIELPIYYLIPNPDMLGVAMNFNDVVGDDIRYMVTEPHFGTIGDLLFRPQFSRNVVQMSPEKIVAGETFHIDPFKGGVFEWGFQETVPKVSIKITSNLEYKRDDKSNRVYFKFNDNQQQGYVNLRWNTNSLMDFSQSSRSLNNLQNKCTITLDVYRNDRYKYQEGEIK